MKCVFMESSISLRPEAKRGGILLVFYILVHYTGCPREQ